MFVLLHCACGYFAINGAGAAIFLQGRGSQVFVERSGFLMVFTITCFVVYFFFKYASDIFHPYGHYSIFSIPVHNPVGI